jgi:hypothetical protein
MNLDLLSIALKERDFVKGYFVRGASPRHFIPNDRRAADSDALPTSWRKFTFDLVRKLVENVQAAGHPLT